MFENVCTLPLPHDVFTQAIHPEEPIVSVGLASGHVHTFRLPDGASDDDDGDDTLASEKGFGLIETTWKTRRHKGSCRALGFGVDGSQLYSAGTDGIVKAADITTGKVTAKIAIPLDPASNGIDHPSLLHALSPQAFLLATDSSALHLYDLRALGPNSAPKPQQTWHPHDDYISSLTPLPPTAASTSGFAKQWVTTGGSTLAVTDLRRGVMVRSEDQEDEMLTSVIVTGLSSRGSSVGQKVLVGGGTGVITLWERGVWDDQDERIVVDRSAGGGDSIDSLAVVPDDIGPSGPHVAVGIGNGAIRFVKIGPNKVVGEVKHDELQAEAVIGLGFDCTGRMISGGGKTVKVWSEKRAEDKEDEEWEDVSDDATGGITGTKRPAESDSDDSDDDSDAEMEDSSDEEKEKSKKKKKKRKGKGGKQAKGHGILGFSGLD